MITYVYKCWKCNRGPKVEQNQGEPELDLSCGRCGRKLFRCNIAPYISTDSTFMAKSHYEDGFGADNVSRMKARAAARKAGVNPEGKRYFPSLAKRQFDPRAWISGKGDVKRICEKEGWGCNGAVNVRERSDDGPNPLDEPYQVDPKLVEKEIATKEALAGERFSKKERADLKASLVTQYSGEHD